LCTSQQSVGAAAGRVSIEKRSFFMKCDECGKDYPSHYYFKTNTLCVTCFNELSVEEKEKATFKHLMKYPMTTTGFTMEGYKIVKHLGVVRGITVRSRSIIGRIGADLQTIFGGQITMFVDLCEKTRSEAFDMMFSHAEQIGANAVIGIRYDATEVVDGVTEVLCYGTAVVVEPE
jgi:uncharacterized protein YbjQ (UPF0145 family)